MRKALLAATVVTASLAGASSAQAINVAGIGYPNGPGAMVSMGNAVAGERNAITIEPSGAALTDLGDPHAPLVPTTVVVTDRATPLGTVEGNCTRVDTHSARCTSSDGFVEVYADLGDGTGNSFVVSPTGLATPMDYEVYSRDGDDEVSIPSSRWLNVDTMGGNDTITATEEGSGTVNAGAGDDVVKLTSDGVTSLYCGDGVDSAVFVANPRLTHGDCESLTP